jgi:hypothetical protein
VFCCDGTVYCESELDRTFFKSEPNLPESRPIAFVSCVMKHTGCIRIGTHDSAICSYGMRSDGSPNPLKRFSIFFPFLCPMLDTPSPSKKLKMDLRRCIRINVSLQQKIYSLLSPACYFLIHERNWSELNPIYALSTIITLIITKLHGHTS